MKTRKPLKELVPNLIAHVKRNSENIKLNTILIDISNGNLLPYVQRSLQAELNKRAYATSKNRIPPINILKKLQLKLSKVYAESPVRSALDNDVDNELLDWYVEGWDLNEQLQFVNDLLIINKYAALEPFMLDGSPDMRVLTAKDFIVYSDSIVTPNEMTVFIKFMGTTLKSSPAIAGLTRIGPEEQVREVPLFHAYSEDEFMVFDADGDVHELRENPHGKIPFCYIRSNKNELIPTPDSDNLPMTLLVPKLLTDLNYAVMFGCRSQIVAIDVEVESLEFSPDSVWVLNSKPGEDKAPSLETIKSEVDVEKVLELINTQVGLWLDAKGVKSGSVGKATIDSAASGVAKLIDESDATAVNRMYLKVFKGVERKLFKLLPKLHNTWIKTGESDKIRTFSKEFAPSVSLIESKIIIDKLEVLNELKLEKELGVFTVERAVRKLNPDMPEAEVLMLLAKLQETEFDIYGLVPEPSE